MGHVLSLRSLGATSVGLRGTVTAYDAWYVAVAEALDCNLATVDHRLSRAQAAGARSSSENSAQPPTLVHRFWWVSGVAERPYLQLPSSRCSERKRRQSLLA